jgi:hypothetical protein
MIADFAIDEAAAGSSRNRLLSQAAREYKNQD